jgi:sugar/nucleoside kinase (ribokinase family)
MAKIVVAASVHLDRIWTLDQPLRPGARVPYSDRSVRLGGGGYFTGTMLLALGHEVVLSLSLARDPAGDAIAAALDQLGFNISLIGRRDGFTPIAEILLDPDGDRTILGHSARWRGGATPPLQGLTADAAYINTLQLDPDRMAEIAALPLVLSQYPLAPVTPRPVDALIGSLADFPGVSTDELWTRAQTLSAPRLTELILTDGPRPIHRLTATGGVTATPAPLPGTVMTIGAGDYFAAAYLHALLEGRAGELALHRASELTGERLVNPPLPTVLEIPGD